jgi:hypothetical protein
MIEIRQRIFLKAVAGIVLACALLFGPGPSPTSAQSVLSSFTSAVPFSSLEQYIGPIFPDGGKGSTFRSEIGGGVAATALAGAKLTGERFGELDLRDVMPLDVSPNRYTFFVDLRAWRLGFRAKYTLFETRSRSRDLGRLDFTGLSLGGDVDLVKFSCCTLGVGAEYYFIDPEFRATLVRLQGDNKPTDQLKGNQPSTVGAYCRYVPPEILGVPVHFEAFLNIPFTGSKLLNYGAFLAFRPQMYRFDMAGKVGVQRTHLKFQSDPSTWYPGSVPIREQSWEVDMEWDMAVLEGVIYF